MTEMRPDKRAGELLTENILNWTQYYANKKTEPQWTRHKIINGDKNTGWRQMNRNGDRIKFNFEQNDCTEDIITELNTEWLNIITELERVT